MPSESPWTSARPEAAGRSLVMVEPGLLTALAAADSAAVEREAPWPIPASLTHRGQRVWQIRELQLASDPSERVWVTRLLMAGDVVVGRAGFHGRPDAHGLVEIGYEVDPAHRRHGHARAAVAILLDIAATEPAVRLVRACVAPGNHPSRSLIDSFGFVPQGQAWDEEDGWEDVLELTVNSAGTGPDAGRGL